MKGFGLYIGKIEDEFNGFRTEFRILLDTYEENILTLVEEMEDKIDNLEEVIAELERGANEKTTGE